MDWAKLAIDLVEFALKVGGEELLRALHGETSRRVEQIRVGKPHIDQALEDLKGGANEPPTQPGGEGSHRGLLTMPGSLGPGTWR